MIEFVNDRFYILTTPIVHCQSSLYANKSLISVFSVTWQHPYAVNNTYRMFLHQKQMLLGANLQRGNFGRKRKEIQAFFGLKEILQEGKGNKGKGNP